MIFLNKLVVIKKKITYQTSYQTTDHNLIKNPKEIIMIQFVK